MSGIKRYDSNDSCEESSDGDYVKFADHAAEISRIQSLFNTAVEGYERATNRHSDAADKYIEAMQEIARLRAEADALRTVASKAREVAAWFTSGNSVPVDGVHLMNVSNHSIMDDVHALNHALTAMGADA